MSKKNKDGIDQNKYLDMIIEEEPEVAQGFDRGLDFEDIKTRLIDKFESLNNDLENLDIDDKFYVRRRRMIIQKMMYASIALIGLRNGARSIEAVSSFKIFVLKNKLKVPVTVKIAKSGCRRYMRRLKKYKITENRYRKMYFPLEWINIEPLLTDFQFYCKDLPYEKLKKRVLDYLLYNFNCNTHSLRYCFINHLLYKEKVPLELVSKIVGHKTQTQILTYVQQKNCNEVLENIFKKTN